MLLQVVVSFSKYSPWHPGRVIVHAENEGGDCINVALRNHYEVTLTDTQTGVSQLTTIFDNTDAQRGVARINGAPAGFVGIQSYPNSHVAFRNIWIK